MCMIDQISTYDAAKWMARLTATDGAISPAERKVLSEFADAFSIDRTKLVRLAYGMTNEVAVPEVEIVNQKEKNGRLFEEFVVSLLADKSIFKLLAWRSDKIVGDTYAAENLYPDLHIFTSWMLPRWSISLSANTAYLGVRTALTCQNNSTATTFTLKPVELNCLSLSEWVALRLLLKNFSSFPVVWSNLTRKLTAPDSSNASAPNRQKHYTTTSNITITNEYSNNLLLCIHVTTFSTSTTT